MEDIRERNAAGQPILVGTVSIEKSERLAGYLKRNGIKHEVLNAKQHTREAQIIAQAGKPGAVTVATNMAGRGVNIALGGNPQELAHAEMRKRDVERDSDEYDEQFNELVEEYSSETEVARQKVLDAGGLYVLGTERHESRRIDNQLRGRSGRQGDPGESRFYLSLEDDLMRRFANERLASIMSRLKIPREVPIEHKMVSKAIERAQNQVESQNFEIRKNVLKYDEVMDTQRKIIYQWRNQILIGDATEELIRGWRDEVVEARVLAMTGGVDPEEWDWDGFTEQMMSVYTPSISKENFDHPSDLTADEAVEAYLVDAEKVYKEREDELTTEVLRRLERTVTLSIIDNKWREHLAEMDYLRSGIGLRAMAQKDPLVEYQREGFDLFSMLVDSVKEDTLRYMYHVKVVQQEAPQRPTAIQTSGPAMAKRRTVRVKDKVGRNAPCPCGSGKKYKMCHGKPGAEPLAG
jgi:preprotein translocase subunit SecA